MHSILTRVVECIAVATRYPRQLLTPHADLEHDLGIDSVKRVEIVAALADEFHLELSKQERHPSIRTIQQVADWIERILDDRLPPTVAALEMSRETSAVRVDVPLASGGQNPVPERINGHKSDTPDGRAAEVAARSRRGPQSPAASPAVPARQAGPTGRQSLDGRVALITGSGHGIGRTIARVLASRGATVVINSFHSRELGDQTTSEINAAGGKAIHLWGSVANPHQVDEIFDQIKHQIGHLDILICNASGGRIGAFDAISPDDWDRAFRTNVSGHYQCAMRARGLMQPRGGGSIVTMSSIAAQRFVEGLGGQGVIKAAVESLTRYLACTLAEHGIRANCVSGGPVYGEVMSQFPDARGTHHFWESIVPDGELCSPMDLANTIGFLVSDEARAINGAIWTVDHGASTRSHSRPLPQPVVVALDTPAFARL